MINMSSSLFIHPKKASSTMLQDTTNLHRQVIATFQDSRFQTVHQWIFQILQISRRLINKTWVTLSNELQPPLNFKL
jgi:hypothetical protein